MWSFLFIAQDTNGDRVAPAAALVSWLTVALAVSLLCWFALSQVRFAWGWEAVFAYREKFLNGWLMTLLVSTAALFLSLLVGLATALAQRASFLPLRYLARLYMEILRGTPLLVQILIFFYVIAEAFGIHNRYLAGIVILAMFAGAYISEIIRAGIESVSETQLESARAIGFTLSDLPLCYHAPGHPTGAAPAGGSVCLTHQGFISPFGHFGQRVHPQCTGSERVHLQHTRELSAAGAWVSCPDPADLPLDQTAGEEIPLCDLKSRASQRVMESMSP